MALLGLAEAVSLIDEPTKTLDEPEMVMEVTLTEAASTVTALVALTPEPSAAVAVMVTDPAAFPVTTPDVDTVALLVSEEDQVTLLLVALEGLMLAERLMVDPTVTLDEPEMVMEDTGTSAAATFSV